MFLENREKEKKRKRELVSGSTSSLRFERDASLQAIRL
jgi:hypothetical protein